MMENPGWTPTIWWILKAGNNRPGKEKEQKDEQTAISCLYRHGKGRREASGEAIPGSIILRSWRLPGRRKTAGWWMW